MDDSAGGRGADVAAAKRSSSFSREARWFATLIAVAAEGLYFVAWLSRENCWGFSAALAWPPLFGAFLYNASHPEGGLRWFSLREWDREPYRRFVVSVWGEERGNQIAEQDWRSWRLADLAVVMFLPPVAVVIGIVMLK